MSARKKQDQHAMMLDEEDISSLVPISMDEKKMNESFCVVKDHLFDDIIEGLYGDALQLKGLVRPAKMSKASGVDEWEDELHRGDSLCWVTPQLCEKFNLKYLEQFSNRVLSGFQVMKKDLGLCSDYSCQFAMYPGNGEGYNRHKDAFDSSRTGHTESTRQLTCLLYLNKSWSPRDGGQLRVFTKPGGRIKNGENPFTFWGVCGYDIDPLFGRMVVFRSEIVEHAVLPCFKERMALTLWINGKGPPSRPVDAISVFKFDAVAKPYESDDHSVSSSDSDISSDASGSGIADVYTPSHQVGESIEVKRYGLWVDGTVIAVKDHRYDVTVENVVLKDKGRYEVRKPGPKHFGTIAIDNPEAELNAIQSKLDWIEFKGKWRNMTANEKNASKHVLFGSNTWSCCGGTWNSQPCGRR